MSMPLVSIIILNWNGYEDTIECLESLYQINYPNYNVILVDNNSTNNSIEEILNYTEGKIEIQSDFFKYNKNNKPIKVTSIKEDKFHDGIDNTTTSTDKKLLLIENYENYGFAKGNNVGIDYTLKYDNPSYVFLLNNDTVVYSNFLTNLMDVALTDDEIGILGPKFYYYDYNGSNDTLWCIGSVVDLEHYPGHHSIMDEENYDTSGNVIRCDWVSGAGLMIKTDAIPEGYLNTDFFFGCEDVDLAVTVHEEGYKVVSVMDSIIWHKTGMSRKKKRSSVSSQLNQIKTNLQFIKKHKKNYYLHLPIYFGQICSMYIKSLLNK